MTPPALGGDDRRQVLASIQARIVRSIQAEFAARGFRRSPSPVGFHRERGGVDSSFVLAISSRPQSLGRVGILVAPFLKVQIPSWSANAQDRLGNEGPPTEQVGGPLLLEDLDLLIPGPTPHWTLSDRPDEREVDALGDRLRAVVAEVGLPYVDQFQTPADILRYLDLGTARVLDASRFTLACGALLEGRPDLARRIVGVMGTARREHVESLLDLSPGAKFRRTPRSPVTRDIDRR